MVVPSSRFMLIALAALGLQSAWADELPLTIVYRAQSYFTAGPPVHAPNGDFYMATLNAGTSGGIVKLTPRGELRMVAYFTGGENQTILALGADGNLYGAFAKGGKGGGLVYESTLTGDLTSLHEFSGPDGLFPAPGLVAARDGSIYGTTTGRPATIFRIMPDGTLTNFKLPAGWSSTGAVTLMQGRDGNFYGTESEGGKSGSGLIFRMTPTGDITVINELDRTAKTPSAPLVEGPDGTLYGTTMFGRSPDDKSTDQEHNAGTVFKLTPGGEFSVLHWFDVTDGARPQAALTWGSDGYLHGATSLIGPRTPGTLFRITPTGEFTCLHHFDLINEGAGSDSLVQVGTDLYGVISMARAGGALFKFAMPPSVAR